MLVLAFRVNYQDDRGSLFAGNLHDKEEARLATRFQENTFSISWRIPSPRRSGLTHRSTSGTVYHNVGRVSYKRNEAFKKQKRLDSHWFCTSFVRGVLIARDIRTRCCV